jgi:hypothetical protein
MTEYPDLTWAEKRVLQQGFCPDCGCKTKWQAGPEAGMCQNWQCGNCGSRFNIADFVLGGPPIQFAERISEPQPFLKHSLAPPKEAA